MSCASAQPNPTGNLFERGCDALPGWMFGLCGATLLAVVVLTPPWLEHHETAWRLQVMQAQAAALSEQAERYEQFAGAIVADDPVVIERLAMTHLRMTAVGKTPLSVRPVEQETGDVGAWLAVPQPVMGRDLPFYNAPDNRLTRIVTGPGRPALLGVGLLCMVAGVLFNPRSTSEAKAQRSASPAPATKRRRSERTVRHPRMAVPH